MGKVDKPTTQKDLENADKNPIPGNKKFGIDQPQPKPEAKKAGWERRQHAQYMMNKVAEYMAMDAEDFREKFLEDVKVIPRGHTVEDLMLAKYATKAYNGEKFMVDWFDRNISKASVQQELTGKDGQELKIIIKDHGDRDNSATETETGIEETI